MLPRPFSFLLGAALLFISPIWAELGDIKSRAEETQDIGLQLDREPEVDEPAGGTYYASYSAIIEYDEGLVKPVCGLNDGELYNLATHAYEEMERMARGQDDRLPGAIAALAYGQKVYLASSVKSNWPSGRIARIDEDLFEEDNVAMYMQQCLLTEGPRGTMSIHRKGGLCAEPNVIRLFQQDVGSKKPVPNRFIVVGKEEKKGNDGNLLPMDTHIYVPCKSTRDDLPGTQGCDTTFKTKFKLNAVEPNVHRDSDPTRTFEFTRKTNPRPAR